MRKFSCIIVEDEPLAAEILQDYVRQVPFLDCKGVCSDAIYAMELLQQQPVDLIFLDIHLPKFKGIDLLKAIQNPPQVIITTAYQDYALQGYELNVVDYLLKPIEFSRFLMAVNKLKQTSETPAPAVVTGNAAPRTHFFFNVSKKRVKIYLDEILYIESLKEYIRISTKDKNILTKVPLGQIEDLLTHHNFLRIHRSFIVAKDKIEAFTAIDVEVNGKSLPIGRSYKEGVMKELEQQW